MIHGISPERRTRRVCRDKAKWESLVFVPESFEHSNDRKERVDLNSLHETGHDGINVLPGSSPREGARKRVGKGE